MTEKILKNRFFINFFEGGFMMFPITQIELARKLGLSQGTVSKILSRCADAFDPKTVKKVMEAARKYKYKFEKIGHKRQSARRSISAPCDITICTPSGDKISTVRGRVENISVTGALITDIKVPSGTIPATKFLMKLHFTEGPLKGLDLISEPVRFAAERGEFSIANRFIKRSRKDRIKITKYIKGTLKELREERFK